jgi:hypothetical protein
VSNVTEDKSQGPDVLDEYLRGGSAFSRLYRGVESDAVPAELDRNVLAEAKSAMVKRKGISWQRVTPMLAIAATAVLTISIVMRSGLESSKPLQFATDSIEKDKAIPEETKNDASASVLVETQVLEKPVVPQELPAIRMMEAPAPVVAAPASPPSRQKLANRESKLEDDKAAAPSARTDAPSTGALSEVVVRGELLRSTPEDAAMPVVVINDESLAKRKDQAVGPRGTIPPVNSQNRDDSDLSQVVVTAQQRSSSGAGAGPRGTVVANPQSSVDRKAEREYRESNPEVWLSYIRELRDAKKSSAADGEWERFVKAYPNFKVSENDSARPRKN